MSHSPLYVWEIRSDRQELKMSYTLTYFPIAGRAEAIRLAFSAAGIDFEDKRIDGATYGGIMNNQEACPLGTLPLLARNGEVIATNSHACVVPV